MKKFLLTGLIALFVLSLTAGEKDGFKPLLNGKDLNGWIVHGTEKWYVQDGLLVCESGPDKKYGYLSTEKELLQF